MPILLASQMSDRLQSATYSPWFALTFILPALILVPAGYYRTRLAFVGIPVAFVAAWLGFAFACNRVAHNQMIIADEYDTWVSDTGLTFAPFFWGTPISGFATLIVAAVGIGLFHRPEPDSDPPLTQHVPNRLPDP